MKYNQGFDWQKPTAQLLGRWHKMINNFIGEKLWTHLCIAGQIKH